MKRRLHKRNEVVSNVLTQPLYLLFLYSEISEEERTQIPKDFFTASIFSIAAASAEAKQLRQPISPCTSM